MQRQTGDVPPKVGQLPGLNGVQPLEQRDRGLDRVVRWTVEPIERAGIPTPRHDVEERRREIDPVNLRFGVRPQAIPRVPQPPDAARRGATGPAGPLFGGILRDPLCHEAVDSARRVVSRDLVQPRVDDRRHSGHGQRCFGDVGRHDDAPLSGGRPLNRPVLIGGVERAVQGKHFNGLRIGQRPQFPNRLVNLERARQKAQHIAAGVRQQVDGCRRDRLLRRIRHVERMRPTLGRPRLDSPRGNARRPERRSSPTSRRAGDPAALSMPASTAQSPGRRGRCARETRR